jgi:hypothetical protein
MSGSVSVLARNSTGTGLERMQLDSNRNLKVDIASSSTGSLEADVNIIADSVGLATENTLVDIQQDTVAINSQTFDISSKITKGEDDTLLEAQQNLIYGRKDESPSGLRAVKVKEEGAVVIADDGVRSRLDTLNNKITKGEDDTLLEAQQVCIYGRKDNAPSGLRALKVSDVGALHTINTFNMIFNNLDNITAGGGGTAISTSQDMRVYHRLSFFGSSTNSTDPIVIEVSADNSTWYEASEYVITPRTVGAVVNFSINILNVAARYWRVKQTDTTTTAFTLIVNSSRK